MSDCEFGLRRTLGGLRFSNFKIMQHALRDDNSQLIKCLNLSQQFLFDKS